MNENIVISGIEELAVNSIGLGERKLSDDELENISGGFCEGDKNLATYGYEVKCPKCGSDKQSVVGKGRVDKGTGSVEYDCKCGYNFICYKTGGTMYVIPKNKWVSKCSEKGYAYTL